MVALRHVDPPKAWGEGPENESLADEVLDELYRQNLISETKRAYFAGSSTRAEAEAAHLSPDPAVRAAQIAALFMQRTSEVERAIRVAVTSQSTRKKLTTRLMSELATALILRAYSDAPAKMDQVRRYLKYGFGKAAHAEPWSGTGSFNRSVGGRRNRGSAAGFREPTTRWTHGSVVYGTGCTCGLSVDRQWPLKR